MHIITKKVTLLPASFVGTKIRVKPAGSLIWGIHAAELAEGSASVLIDWGDGTRQSCSEVNDLTHTYPAEGVYEVRISDDISTLCCSDYQGDFREVYAPQIVGLESNATKLKTLGVSAFDNASSLTEFVIPAERIESRVFADCSNLQVARLLNVKEIGGSILPSRPFYGCAALREIHFSEVNRTDIEATPYYATDPTFGSKTDVQLFFES